MDRSDKLCLVAVLIVIVVAMIGWNWYDVKIFLNWVLASKQLSIIRIYEAYELYGPQFRAVYPPLPILVFIATDIFANKLIKGVSSLATTISTEFLPIFISYANKLLLKLPVIIPTLLLAMLLSRFCKKKEAAYWLLLGIPTLITVGTYQFDSLLALFLFLSIVSLTRWRKDWISALFLALATLTKPIAAIFYLPIAFYIGDRKKALRYLGVLATFITIGVLPFLMIEPKAFLENVLAFHMDRPPQYSSIWNIPILLSMRDPRVVSLIDKLWIFGYATALGIIMALFKPKVGDERSLLISIVAIGIVTTFANKVVNPNYLMWVYPEIVMLAMAYGLTRAAKTYNIYCCIGTLWPAIYVAIPALVGAPMYIEEVSNYISARKLLLESLNPPFNKTFETIFKVLDKSELHRYTLTLYHHLYLVGTALILAYTFLGLKIIVMLRRRGHGFR